MASQTDICNLALFKMGQSQTITSMVENSKESRIFNRLWAQGLDLVLSDGMWPWATVARKLALSVTDPDMGFSVRYSRPNDCLTAWAVTSADGLRFARSFGGIACFCERGNPWGLPIADFEQVYGANETEILTDWPDAYLVYTVRVEDTSRFPAHFVDTLASRLAADAAPGIVAEFGLRNKGNLLQEYELSRSRALAHDLNEMRNTMEPLTPALQARR